MTVVSCGYELSTIDHFPTLIGTNGPFMHLVATKLGDRSLKNDVCAEIVRMLHDGELRPGDRISEADIAARLGISRSPVREAFVQLAHEGVIVQKPRSGNFISSRSDQELVDLQETRVLIETYSARVVCAEFSAESADRLARIITDMANVEGTPNWLEGSRLNASFHQSVVELTGNSSLIRLWKSLDPLTWLLAPWSIPPGSRAQNDLVSRHQALFDALDSRDPDRAASEFSDHVLRATILAGGQTARLDHLLAAADRSR